MSENVVALPGIKGPAPKLHPADELDFNIMEAVIGAEHAGLDGATILRILQRNTEELIAKTSWRESAESAWSDRHLLRSNEIEFIQQLRYYRANPSARQLIWLDDIIRCLKERAEILANPPPPPPRIPRKKPKRGSAPQSKDGTAER